MTVTDNDDIWSGARVRKEGEPAPDTAYHFGYHTHHSEPSDFVYIAKIIFCILVIVGVLYLSFAGPEMWHNKLVVCYGTNCSEYTSWKVINENQESGVLEVWAGGRLQRLSPGTWHYE